MHKLGGVYDSSDKAKAFHFYSKAFKAGHNESLGKLFKMYRNTLDDEENITKNMWLNEAHKLINNEATQNKYLQESIDEINISIALKNHDYAEALKKINKAVKQGDTDALLTLSDLYFQGKGVQQNSSKAFGFLFQAAKQKNFKAISRLGIETGIDYEEVQENKLFIKWLTNAANNGEIDAKICLGKMYFFGIGVEQNHLNALNWFNSLSEMNDASLHLHIGYLHYKGSGIKKDLKKSF